LRRLVPEAAVSNRSKPTLYSITVSARGWDEGQPETAKEMRRSCQSAAKRRRSDEGGHSVATDHASRRFYSR